MPIQRRSPPFPRRGALAHGFPRARRHRQDDRHPQIVHGHPLRPQSWFAACSRRRCIRGPGRSAIVHRHRGRARPGRASHRTIQSHGTDRSGRRSTRSTASDPAAQPRRPRSRCSAPCCCPATRSPRRSRSCAPSDFYKPAHGHVFDAILALYGSGEPADPITVAEELTPRRPARGHRWPGAARDAAGQRAGHLQRRPLRPHRRGARAAAADDRRGRRDRRARLLAARRRRQGGRPGRVDDLRRSPSAGRGHDGDHPPTCSTQSLDRLEQLYERGESITGTPTGYLDLDELLAGPPAQRPGRRRRPPGHGQDGLRPRHGRHAALEARSRCCSSPSR